MGLGGECLRAGLRECCGAAVLNWWSVKSSFLLSIKECFDHNFFRSRKIDFQFILTFKNSLKRQLSIMSSQENFESAKLNRALQNKYQALYLLSLSIHQSIYFSQSSFSIKLNASSHRGPAHTRQPWWPRPRPSAAGASSSQRNHSEKC